MAVPVVTRVQKEREQQALHDKVMTAVQLRHLVMVAVAVLVHQEEMEILQIAEQLLVRVELV